MTKYQLRTKLKAIRMVKEEGQTCGCAAKELGLGKRTVQRWVDYYNEYGGAELNIKLKNYNRGLPPLIGPNPKLVLN